MSNTIIKDLIINELLNKIKTEMSRGTAFKLIDEILSEHKTNIEEVFGFNKKRKIFTVLLAKNFRVQKKNIIRVDKNQKNLNNVEINKNTDLLTENTKYQIEVPTLTHHTSVNNQTFSNINNNVSPIFQKFINNNGSNNVDNSQVSLISDNTNSTNENIVSKEMNNKIKPKKVNGNIRFEDSSHSTTTFDDSYFNEYNDDNQSVSSTFINSITKMNIGQQNLDVEVIEKFSDNEETFIDRSEIFYKTFFGINTESLSRIKNDKILIDSIQFMKLFNSTESAYIDYGCLGSTISLDKHIYINIQQPLCLICIGIQGSGKSHTMNVVLENCFLNFSYPLFMPITYLHQPMCGLVLHYDQSPTNICEAIGLVSISSNILSSLPSNIINTNINSIMKVCILVSPSYYKQRKSFYNDLKGIEIYPLLFQWSSLNAQQLKKLMRVSESDSQLYVNVILDLLRQFQRDDKIPIFPDFQKKVLELCKVSGQNAPLKQRLRLLESVVLQSDMNESFRSDMNIPTLSSLMNSNTLIIADLTDPMLSADEANGIFQVLLEQFRNKPMKNIGKVVAFDEAHKYLSKEGGVGKDELSQAIVDTVRLMRHEGIRILISTQSPLALPSELLELVTVTMIHQFQSKDWFDFLSSKIPLPFDAFSNIKKLQVGETLCVSTKFDESITEDNSIHLKVRPRLTNDYGKSKINKASKVV